MRSLRMLALVFPMVTALACRDLTTAPVETAVAKVRANAVLMQELPVLLQIDISDPSHMRIRSTGSHSAVTYDGNNPSPYSTISAYDGVVLSLFFQADMVYDDLLVLNGNLAVATVISGTRLQGAYSTGIWHPGYDLGLAANSADDREVPQYHSPETPSFIAAPGSADPAESWFDGRRLRTKAGVGEFLPRPGTTGTIWIGWSNNIGPTIGRWEVVTEFGAQSITFTSIVPALPMVNVAYAVTATATSGLPVSFTSLTPAICTLTGSTATFVAAGMCTIAANQAGNFYWHAAPEQTQSITVLSAAQAVVNLVTVIGGMGLPKGAEASLGATIKNLDTDNASSACAKLNAFVNKVNGDQAKGALTAAQAAQLLQAASLIKSNVGCS